MAGGAHRRNSGAPRTRHVRRRRDVWPSLVGGPRAARPFYRRATCHRWTSKRCRRRSPTGQPTVSSNPVRDRRRVPGRAAQPKSNRRRRETFRRSCSSVEHILMFEHDDGVVLIDQHSAHERVLYEQFMRTLEQGAQPAQRLLFPMTLHLGPAESDAFEANREIFERLGFEIEGFGGHTLLVRSVPMPHPRFDPERCVRETLAALTGDRDDRRARAPRAARGDRRLQGRDQGRRCAVARRDARAVHRAARHDAACARRPRSRDDRAADLGRD